MPYIRHTFKQSRLSSVVVSGSLFDEISVRTPLILFSIIMLIFYRSKYPKNTLFSFETRSTGVCIYRIYTYIYRISTVLLLRIQAIVTFTTVVSRKQDKRVWCDDVLSCTVIFFKVEIIVFAMV